MLSREGVQNLGVDSFTDFWNMTQDTGKVKHAFQTRGLFGGGEKQPQKAPRASGPHPRSHWGQYAAFPDARISLLIWPPEARM